MELKPADDAAILFAIDIEYKKQPYEYYISRTRFLNKLTLFILFMCSSSLAPSSDEDFLRQGGNKQ